MWNGLISLVWVSVARERWKPRQKGKTEEADLGAELTGETCPSEHDQRSKEGAPGCPFLDRGSGCHLNLEIGDRERVLARLPAARVLMAPASGWAEDGLAVVEFLHYSGCHFFSLLAGPLVSCSNNK